MYDMAAARYQTVPGSSGYRKTNGQGAIRRWRGNYEEPCEDQKFRVKPFLKGLRASKGQSPLAGSHLSYFQNFSQLHFLEIYGAQHPKNAQKRLYRQADASGFKPEAFLYQPGVPVFALIPQGRGFRPA